MSAWATHRNAGNHAARLARPAGRVFLLPAAFLAALASSARAGDPPAPRPMPVSAHNCYPQDGQGTSRLADALALGLDNIEIDLGWDAAAKRLIVGHDAEPKPGAVYPELSAYLVPALEAHWRTPRPDRAPTVLTIDWKTANPEAVRAFKTFLDRHADWFSSAPKAAESPLTVRRLTVCLTGDDRAKRLYDDLVAPGEVYRAFRDQVFGAGSRWMADVAHYAPQPASAYHRFLTFYWGHVEKGGPPLAGSWTQADAQRLGDLVNLSHRQGYRVRFYTLNGHIGPLGHPYRFLSDAAAHTRWQAAEKAGADWVATDEYQDIARMRGQ